MQIAAFFIRPPGDDTADSKCLKYGKKEFCSKSVQNAAEPEKTGIGNVFQHFIHKLIPGFCG